MTDGSEDGKMHCLKQREVAAEAEPQISKLTSKQERRECQMIPVTRSRTSTTTMKNRELMNY